MKILLTYFSATGNTGKMAKCPDDVLKINDLSATWSFKLEMKKTTEESIKKNE